MLSLIAALALAVPVGAATAEVSYYVLAENNLSDAGKRLDGTKFKDTELGKLFGDNQGNTAVLLRVEKMDGKVNEIHVSVARERQAKTIPVRDKPYTAADDDFKHLLKALNLKE